jgi:hypothetical protein
MKRLAIMGTLLCCVIGAVQLAEAAERFDNGDFEAGATGFTSDYSYHATDNTLAGQFSVVDSPLDVHPSWANYGDNTTGTGLMLTANGSTTAGLAVWRQTVAVVLGEDYTFSAWAANSFTNNPAALSFRADGVEFLSLQLGSALGQWANVTTVLNSGAATSIEFEIVDTSTFGNGNDFSLDDISLDGPVPVPEPSGLILLLAECAGIVALGRQ